MSPAITMSEENLTNTIETSTDSSENTESLHSRWFDRVRFALVNQRLLFQWNLIDVGLVGTPFFELPSGIVIS